MPLRRFAVLLCAVCLCTVITTVAVLHSISGTGHKADAPLRGTLANTQAGPFAYITERQLVLIRGSQMLARVPRVFSEFDPAQNKVVWTNDGNHLALLKDVTLLQEPLSAEELITVNARTGDVKYFPCPQCYDLTPVGKSIILVATNSSDNSAELKFREFNLDSDGSGTPVDLNLPAGGQSVRSFLASTQNYVLTHQGTSGAGGDYEEQLELTRVNGGHQINLGVFSSNDYMHAAVSENMNGTGAGIAVAFNSNAGECAADFPIYIFTSSGGIFKTDMSNTMPSGHAPGINEGLEVNDLWWGSDGHFHATITSWTCDSSMRTENAKEVLANPSALWTLDGRTWIRESRSPATMVRQPDQTTRIVLVIPGCIGPETHPDPIIYCNTGTLYREQDGKQAAIARGVISITAPPPEYVPRVLPTAIPVLGQLAGNFVEGEGFGRIKPSEIYNGGDPTGLVTHVTWKSWGGPRAIATGESEYVGPNQTTTSGSEERATVVAFDLGTCDGERMYQAVEWYFPQHGQTFDPHQYENVCIGSYVPNP